VRNRRHSTTPARGIPPPRSTKPAAWPFKTTSHQSWIVPLSPIPPSYFLIGCHPPNGHQTQYPPDQNVPASPFPPPVKPLVSKNIHPPGAPSFGSFEGWGVCRSPQRLSVPHPCTKRKDGAPITSRVGHPPPITSRVGHPPGTAARRRLHSRRLEPADDYINVPSWVPFRTPS
jgi:hypothetical protein